MQEPNLVDLAADMTAVYRPMADKEFEHLRMHNQLPATQPYQTIVEGADGRCYSEKYLTGKKWVDTQPTTVVEFVVPAVLIRALFARQCKPEDGCLSHGLGSRGGNGLADFNECLADGSGTWRPVLIKRPLKK